MKDKERQFRQQAGKVVQECAQLPEPEKEQLDLSEALQHRIRQEIQSQGGSVFFEQFMQMALYEPGLGYYTSGLHKFGEGGDFVTAPEISPLFGRCLAHFCLPVFDMIQDRTILEFGAGSGRMAADILSELDRLESLPSAYLILELGEELRQRQAETLKNQVPHLLNRVQWLQQLPGPGFKGIVLGNELLDAMPVYRFQIGNAELQEMAVQWSAQRRGFVSVSMPPRHELIQAVGHIQQYLGHELAHGYESEVSLSQTAWVKSVSDFMQEGVALLIDYGYGRPEYYHPDRSMGTLMCHYRHRAHPDPFRYVGLQDITSYVDFTAVAEAGTGSGMDLLGYTTQCGFLLGNGLESMMPDLDSASQQDLLTVSRQVKTLTMPGEMGERFKVMALGKGINCGLQGFALQDQRGRL